MKHGEFWKKHTFGANLGVKKIICGSPEHSIRKLLYFLPEYWLSYLHFCFPLPMLHPNKKSACAKTKWQADTLSFSLKPVENETNLESSDHEWMDDKDNESDIGKPHVQMASLYSFFLPRHCKPRQQYSMMKRR